MCEHSDTLWLANAGAPGVFIPFLCSWAGMRKKEVTWPGQHEAKLIHTKSPPYSRG